MTILADVKTILGPPVSTGTAHDALLGIYIASVLDSADDFMHVAYQQVAAATKYYDGGEKTIYLPHVNVSNVSVYENGSLLVADEDYFLYPERGKIQASDARKHFRAGQRNIRVVYSGGYGEDSIPSELRVKLLKQITYEFRRRNDPGLISVTSPDGTVQKFDVGEWLKDVEEFLKRKRRIIL